MLGHHSRRPARPDWGATSPGGASITSSKKGADRGLDDWLYCGKTGHGIVSVKAGDDVGVSLIHDLKGVMMREKAGIGVVLTLIEPIKPMITEGASAGPHE